MAQQYSVEINIKATGDAVLAKVNSGIQKVEKALDRLGPKSRKAFSRIQRLDKAARAVAASFIKAGRKIESSFGKLQRS